MDITTRLLALVVELFFVPAGIEDKKARQIFDRISDTHNITTFSSLPGEGIIMETNKGQAGIINYKIMKDRVVMVYEFCDKSLNYYVGLVSDFIDIFKNITNISFYIVHNITLRKLVNIPGVNDTREFIIKNIYSLKDENLKPFGRPLHLIGTRIFFPATSNENIESFDSKIETSLEDLKTFFIENKGIFPRPVNLLLPSDNNIINNNIDKTEKFLSENIINFILQFL